MRVRTTVLQAHSHHWLGTFGGPGNGDYQGELERACQAIIHYAGWLCMPLSRVLVRLDGLYGTTAALIKLLLSGIGVIVRYKNYALLDLPAIASRLKHPPDQHTIHPESGARRALFDCPDIALLPGGPRVRFIVATHPTTSATKPPVGVLRDGTVYELFLTTAPQAAFTCSDVLDLYLHRGSFETVLSDEDREQDPDRWCSHTACGQECWQIVNQWIWNLRLELGQHLSPSPLCLTEFAPAQQPAAVPCSEPAHSSPATPPGELTEQPAAVPCSEPAQEPPSVPPGEPAKFGPPQWARLSFTKGFAGSDFVPQPDGSLRCPAGHPLFVHERRPERNGSVRVVYGARITHCRPCPLRAQCQETATARKPRQVSAVLWPVEASPAQPPPPVAAPDLHESPPSLASPASASALAPILWGDWPRCQFRRSFMRLLRTQTVVLSFRPLQSEEDGSSSHDDHLQTRAERAHWRLSWQQRLARNVHPSLADALTVTIYGLPAAFAQYLGVSLITAA